MTRRAIRPLLSLAREAAWLAAGLFSLVRLPAGEGALFLEPGSSVEARFAAGAGLLRTPPLDADATYSFSFAIRTVPLAADGRWRLELGTAAGPLRAKTLHAGDPGLHLLFHVPGGRAASARLAPEDAGGGAPAAIDIDVSASLTRAAAGPDEALSFEAEPNDDWRTANPLVPGRALHGGADDIEYLDNRDEGKVGIDWFRIEHAAAEPALVYFDLDLLDRDVSPNLSFHALAPDGGDIAPYTRGKDPMEVLHDGQKVRYSKFITRVLERGTYFLKVNANHPDYTLRTTVHPVPPYADPRQAVEAGMHYLLSIGDAWHAQQPRLGSTFTRAVNLHDEAHRCTACHPTVFPTEAALTAHENGYSIRPKGQFQHLIERLYNAPVPLYGREGAYWMRFIGIPLQAAGKQAGVVMDYERLVSGRQTLIPGRHTGFLKLAWDGREDLPADENNGVSPLDSKFGFAWRDWKVLTEWARRSGDRGAAATAARIERLVTAEASRNRIEGTQDRIHRLLALHLMGAERHAAEIRSEAERFLAAQNPDGSWPGDEEKPLVETYRMRDKRGLEYLTGQILHTLLEVGVDPEREPRLEKAARWLLSRQGEFGGWFQTDTVENFVTPMRETRYAVMALARLFPRARPAAPGRGLENRSGGPARPPRAGPGVPIHVTLDDLDDVWQVRESEREGPAGAVAPLLVHAEPLVRARAAALLGRIGVERSTADLAPLLADPVKAVWQAAAFSLRRLGNEGLGIARLGAALDDSDPLLRRGATRVFSYQFHGMDGRRDLLRRLVDRLADPDLLARHQAARALAQWWYRTEDDADRRSIVEGLVARLAAPGEHPLQRFNLSQAIYIVIDENRGRPGTGYNRWTPYLGPESAGRVFAERTRVEAEVLFPPLLAALERGTSLQRRGVLAAFDGTPFSRSYLGAAFGPGNDREFGFEGGGKVAGLDAALAAVLSDADPEVRGRGLLLAGFLDAFGPAGPRREELARSALAALDDADAGVRAAGVRAIEKLPLAELPELVAASIAPLAASASPEARQGLLEIARRVPAVVERPEAAAAVRAALAEPRLAARALPLLAAPAFSDAEALAAIARVWSVSLAAEDDTGSDFDRLVQRNALLSPAALDEVRRAAESRPARPPEELLAALELLERRRSLLESAEALRFVRRAGAHANARLRQALFETLGRLGTLAREPALAKMVRDALLDEAVEVQRAALALAVENDAVWEAPDAREHLLQLLVHPDRDVRARSLAAVERRRLLAGDGRFAGRLKALTGDGEPAAEHRERARQLLLAAGLDPGKVAASAAVGRRPALDLAAFREKVNPIFYVETGEGASRHACANCHATHNLLRLAEPPAEGRALGEKEIERNFQSVLKVIDLNDPEGSLLLRKPRSPAGQGDAWEKSPTGVTHVGGERWPDGAGDPAYQAILAWLRGAK